jgi:hypothetical protein
VNGNGWSVVNDNVLVLVCIVVCIWYFEVCTLECTGGGCAPGVFRREEQGGIGGTVVLEVGDNNVMVTPMRVTICRNSMDL